MASERWSNAFVTSRQASPVKPSLPRANMKPTPQRVPLPTMEDHPPVPPPASPSMSPPSQPDVQHTPEDIERLETEIIEALQSCYDPEIPVNIYELGLIYDVDIKPSGAVTV